MLYHTGESVSKRKSVDWGGFSMTDAAGRDAANGAAAAAVPPSGPPLGRGDVLGDYQALQETVGVARKPADHVDVCGADRAKFLHNFCTNEIVKLPVGRGCEAFFLNPKGKIVDYGVIYAWDDRLSIELEPGRGAAMVRHLDRFHFREDVKMSDRSSELASLFVSGPKAADLLAAVADGWRGPMEELQAASIPVAGRTCRIQRWDRSVRPGYTLVVAAADADAVWSEVVQACAQLRGRPVGPEALEIARIEAGLPRMGREATEDNLPQEIGRDARTISFTKGCYIGQETVARLDAYGHVNKLLRGLVADVQAPICAGQTVERDGKAIGAVASAADSPALGRRVATAVLRTAGAEPGTSVFVRTDAGPTPATVAALPFV
jgi:folate-binding protein YgfZ